MSEQAALHRQWRILERLAGHGPGLSVDDLARDLEVTPRTIRRDLQTFKAVGLSIRENTARHGRKIYRLERWTAGDQRAFTFDEAFALYLGRQFLQPLTGTLIGMAAESAFAKIRDSLGQSALNYLRRMQHAVHDTPFGFADYTRHADILDALLIGIEDRRVIRLTYQSQRAARPSSYSIHPYRLTRYQGSLYLIGRKAAEPGIRTWRVDRIAVAEPDETRFMVPADLDLDAHFAGSFGIYDGDQPCTVRIWIAAARARYVQEKHWHSSQRLDPLPDGSLTITFDLTSTVEVKSWLLGFGRDAELLEPAWLRSELSDEFHELASRYRRPIQPHPSSDSPKKPNGLDATCPPDRLQSTRPPPRQSQHPTE